MRAASLQTLKFFIVFLLVSFPATRAELVVWRLDQNFTPVWYLYNLASSRLIVKQAEVSDTDLNPAAGNFDGDGRADFAMYNVNETLNWHISYSGATGSLLIVNWGLAADIILVPADYDGDGQTDIAVFRSGIWYLRQSADGFSAQQFGLAGDKPAAARYVP